MRKFILIAAAMVLASATAHAGDSRSLSTGPTNTMSTDQPAAVDNHRLQADNDTTATTPPSQPDTPRYTPPPEDTPHEVEPAPTASETPHYTARPAPVETVTPSTTYHRHAGERTSHPGRVRHAHAEWPYHRGTYWTAGRIIAELHRYGIYW